MVKSCLRLLKTKLSTYAKRLALKFVLLMGVVSLFGDVTYEGARGVIGPYLGLLGASAVIIGGLTGAAEFIGYTLRIATGAITDRLRNPWIAIYLGYALNLIAIPLLAVAGRWEQAAVLVVLERVGKSIRTPGRDAMISEATSSIGRGMGFGIHEALDQVGAVAGPVIVSLAIYLSGDYKVGFAILAIPAMITLVFLDISRRNFPRTSVNFYRASKPRSNPRISKKFMSYLLFVFTSSAGLISFQLLSYHVKTGNFVPDYLLPLLYGLAMGVDAIAALGIGRAYDKHGLRVLMILPLLIIPIIPLTLLGTVISIVVAVIVWGIVIGMQETVLRAAVSELSGSSSIGFAYGLLNATYGIALMTGGLIMGMLYEYSLQLLALYAVLMELASFGILAVGLKKQTSNDPHQLDV